jgi:hypothetical protein
MMGGLVSMKNAQQGMDYQKKSSKGVRVPAARRAGKGAIFAVVKSA